MAGEKISKKKRADVSKEKSPSVLPSARKKPKFRRQSWNKLIKLGKTVKKKRKWRAAKGGDSKVRLRERGYARRPAIGWGADKKIKGKINGWDAERVENLKQLGEIKTQAIIIGKVGKRKRAEIIKKANEMKIKILNKYKKRGDEKNATG